MVYVKRDLEHNIMSIHDKDTEEKLENLPSDNKDVVDFLTRCELDKKSSFLNSDLELIRVIEDLIQILISKHVISITDFPLSAIEKLMARNKIRQELKGLSDIMRE